MTILDALVKLRDDLKTWCINNFNNKLNKSLGVERHDMFLATNGNGDITTVDIGVKPSELKRVTSNIQTQLDNMETLKADKPTVNYEISKLKTQLSNKAAQVDLDIHTNDTDIHTTSSERSKLNTSYTHSQSAHAPSDATKVENSAINGNVLIKGTETNVYTHPNSTVEPGEYKIVTVDEQGHIISGKNPTTLKDFGITDKEIKDYAESALNPHAADTTKHITSAERTNWNAAKTHADSAHAPSNAEKNQNAFSNVKVGSTTVAADSATDTLTLEGANITITPDTTNDKIAFSVADGSTTTKGVVQLTNSISSTSTTTAATPNSVKSAYDLASSAQEAADVAQATADSKVSPCTINADITRGAKSITFTTSNVNTEWRYLDTNGITSLTLSQSGAFSGSAEAFYSIVFKSGATTTTVTDNLTAYFTGDDCVGGVFTPVQNTIYDIGIYWNGFGWQALVRGVLL